MTTNGSMFNRSFFVTSAFIILGGVVMFAAVYGALYLGSRLNPTYNPAPPQVTTPSLTPEANQPSWTQVSAGSETQPVTPHPEEGSSTPANAVPSSTGPISTEADASPTPTGTLTATPTPTSTRTSAGTTPTYQPDDWAKLIESKPVDGEYFAPKAEFTKVWTIKNVGTTTWTTDYDLVYFSGTAMNEKRVFSLKEKIKPGKTIELKLKQTVPAKPGSYQGSWMLRNSHGVLFGIGSEAELPLTVKVSVLNVDPKNAYDFLLNYCDAEWWNSLGQPISCPAEPKRIGGFVLRVSQPVLENGLDDIPVLWVHPDSNLEGIISGKFPPYTVKAGDHFKARVGCISGYPKCNVTFKLLYKIGTDPNQNLGSWKELYGGGTTNIDVDLSALAGQNVQFILRMICTNNYPDSAQGFWMTPRIIFIKPTPTPTAVPTDTAVPTPSDTVAPADTPSP
jgi:hypothetical protein